MKATVLSGDRYIGCILEDGWVTLVNRRAGKLVFEPAVVHPEFGYMVARSDGETITMWDRPQKVVDRVQLQLANKVRVISQSEIDDTPNNISQATLDLFTKGRKTF